MDIELTHHNISAMCYELSAVMARLGDEVTDEDEERMMELIRQIAYLDSKLYIYCSEEAIRITQQILHEAKNST